MKNKSEIAKLDRKPVKRDFLNKRYFHRGESYPHMTGPCPAIKKLVTNATKRTIAPNVVKVNM